MGRLPGGCAFHPRCTVARDNCRGMAPALRQVGNHAAACHFAFAPAEAGA
ncbi:hypothetical protein [Aphanothece microscopica]